MPRPAADQEAKLDAVGRRHARAGRRWRARSGFPVKVTIVGHADATGKDTSNLALSLGRAEVVRSMLRARGVDPTVLAVRGAGPLEPLQARRQRGRAVDEPARLLRREHQRLGPPCCKRRSACSARSAWARPAWCAAIVDTIFSDAYLTTVGVKIDKKVLTVGTRAAGADPLGHRRRGRGRGGARELPARRGRLPAGGRRHAARDAGDRARRSSRASARRSAPFPSSSCSTRRTCRRTGRSRRSASRRWRPRAGPFAAPAPRRATGVEETFQELAARLAR